MPKTCSDQHFIDVFKRLQSPALVAKEIGVSERNVAARRRRLEYKYGMKLPVVSRNAGASRHNQALVEPNRAIIKYRIDDGYVLIGSDAHVWPGERTTMQRAFVKFAKKLKPLAIIANGDFFDGARISRYPDIGWEKKPSVRQELEAVQDFLADIVKAAPEAKRFWPKGNHDGRYENKLAAMVPEFVGAQGMQLKDHFEHWLPCWRVDINDDIIVKHRGVGGEHASYNNTVKSGMTMITGHDHRADVKAYTDYRGERYGVRCGYMAESPQDTQFQNYLEAGTPNWQPAFCVLRFVDGKLLYPQLVKKHGDGRVTYCNEVFDV